MGINRYGLDADYFSKNLEILLRDIQNYRPDEMARTLHRLANVAENQRIPHTEEVE